MHGAGNDFVVFADLEDQLEISESMVRKLCDRNFGVGGDGIIRITRDQGMYFMDYRNADGSIARMCGNGVRTVGKWLGDRNLAGDSVNVSTRSGLKELQLVRGKDGRVASVRVDMGPPQSELETIELDTPIGKRQLHTLRVGDPHAVMFIESIDDFQELDVATVGSAIEKNPHFPEGTNAEFAVVKDDGALLRTWERGAGETLSCGTGVCATAVAATVTGKVTGGKPVKVETLGGVLEIEWTPGGSILMTGPAAEAFRGVVDLESL